MITSGINWLAIINPAAANGKTLQYWQQKIEPLMQAASINYHTAFTTQAFEAADLTAQAIENGNRYILCVGGDGTLHEVVNGIMQQKAVATNEVILAVIPSGTGNDWVKTTNIPKNPKQAVELLLQINDTYLHDVGRISYMPIQAAAIEESRYFINVAGAGFDGYVVERIEASGKKFGPFTYLIGVAMATLTYKNAIAKVSTADGKKWETPIYIAALGVGKYLGEGMCICPHAKPNDGKLALTLLQNVSKWQIARYIRSLYNGTFPKYVDCQLTKVDAITIVPDVHKNSKDLFVQADGEFLGKAPMRISVIPGAIQVLGKQFLSPTNDKV